MHTSGLWICTSQFFYMMYRVTNHGLSPDLAERIAPVKMVSRRTLVADPLFIRLDPVIGSGFKEIHSNLKILNKTLKILQIKIK